jgi:hypothetical protein
MRRLRWIVLERRFLTENHRQTAVDLRGLLMKSKLQRGTPRQKGVTSS